MEIYLIRHPEAYKNVSDEHGGTGTPLTSIGLKHCDIIYEKFLSQYKDKQKISFWGNSVEQVKETVSKLNRDKSFCDFDDKLTGIYLGGLDGLSREKATKENPEAAKLLELWRKGELTLDKLIIPDGESAIGFYNRIFEKWQSILSHENSVKVIVLTRSVYIMLLNILKLGEDFNFKDYKVYTIPNSSVTIINFRNGAMNIKYENSTDYLEQ